MPLWRTRGLFEAEGSVFAGVKGDNLSPLKEKLNGATVGAMMNKTNAIQESRLCVSVYRWGRNWTMSCPWDMSRPLGPCAGHQYATYAQARRAAACARAEVVLSMMGRLSEEARAEVHWHSSDPHKDHSFRALVKAGLSV